MYAVAAANGEIPAELEALEALESIARARGDRSGGKCDAEKLAKVVDAFLVRLRAPPSRADARARGNDDAESGAQRTRGR